MCTRMHDRTCICDAPRRSLLRPSRRIYQPTPRKPIPDASAAYRTLSNFESQATYTHWSLLAYPHLLDPFGALSAYRKEVLGLEDPM